MCSHSFNSDPIKHSDAEGCHRACPSTHAQLDRRLKERHFREEPNPVQLPDSSKSRGGGVRRSGRVATVLTSSRERKANYKYVDLQRCSRRNKVKIPGADISGLAQRQGEATPSLRQSVTHPDSKALRSLSSPPLRVS